MRSLEHQGVTTIFGYPGGSIMPVFDALYDHQNILNHILVRHEQGAAHAAQGYARVSGDVGVCLVTSGPGATNTVTGIAENEFLRGPFALFEAHSRAKFVRNLIKHGWASISPAELIPPPSPVQGFARDGRLRRRFSHTGHGPLRPLIVSNLKWGGPCRGHYVFLAGRYQIFHNSLIKVH